MPVQAGPSLRFRRIMFIIFTASFVMVTALVLLEGNGYVIHLPSRTLLTTGSMLVKVEPADAVVTVAGVAHTKGSPVRITRLTPRTVPVSITAPGYYPWSKRLAVDPQHATFVDTVLVRAVEPIHIATFPANHTVSLSPDGATLLQWDPGSVGVTSTQIITITDNGAVAHTIATPFAPSSLSVAWSADSTRAALSWSTGTRHATFIFSSAKQEFSGALEHDQLSFVRWDGASPWVAVVRGADGGLFHLHAITHEVTPRVGTATPLVRDQRYLYTTDAPTTRTVAVTPLTGDDEPTALSFDAVSGASTEEATVLMNDFEVWYSHQGSPFALLARTSDPLIAAYPIPEMPYALLHTKSRVQLVAFDGRDTRMVYSVLTDRTVEQVGVDSNGRKLRVVTADTAGTRSLVDLWIR